MGAARIAAVAMVVVVTTVGGLWAGTVLNGRSSVAQTFTNPHGAYSATTDSCATCHRSHTGQSRNLLNNAEPQSTLCFSCHDGTGASYNVAAQYSDISVPPNDPTTSSFYSHPATTSSNHSSGRVDEFAGVLNRHAECGDCHDPHLVDASLPVATGSGWTASGALAGSSGVAAGTPLVWKDTITHEYELCLKCHSSYTTLLSYTKESYKKTDKAGEFDPANNSYHPVEAPGKNTTTAMANSLAGGNRWQFSTGDTVRCAHCHGNYRAGGPPGAEDRLSPHSSPYRGLLIANYRDRQLKPQNEAYTASDFALCYLCHSETPFSAGSNQQTNFRHHKRHLTSIENDGDPGLGTDIDTPGAGQGNAICAECHYQAHSTKFAPWSTNRDNERGVNFAPNVQPVSGNLEPIWSLADRSCTLVCHGKKHDPRNY